MKRKIIGFSLIAVLLLTGCGRKEQIWKQAVNPEMTFLDTEKEVNDLLKQADAQTENEIFSQKMIEEIGKLEEALKEPLAKGLLVNDEADEGYEDYEEDEDYEDYDEDYEDTMSLSSFCEKFQSGAVKELSLGEEICSDYVADNTEALQEAFRMLEKKGYAGLGSLIENYSDNEYTGTAKIIHGIEFSIYTEGKQWSFSVRVCARQLYHAKTIDDFIQSNVEDCFVVNNCITGGYIERIKMSGNKGLKNEDFSNIIIADIRENKTIRLAVNIESNKKQVSGKAFTEEQQPTVIRLLTQMTGDEKASEEFVKNLELKTDKKGRPITGAKTGKIGNKSYQLQESDSFYSDFTTFILNIE